MERTTGRALRADAERSVRAILEAAERVLAADPAASLEQVATAAGVARTTVHRRFANRQALLDALADSAARQLAQAVGDGRPETAPPLVAIHRITANVLQVKGAWTFALQLPPETGSEAAALHADVHRACLALLARAREDGLLDPGADLEWTSRVYYALIGESLREAGEPDALAARVVETLLHGAGKRD
ncbi:TetR/AcrR family transcriptional regulator [Glycomyces paridis]|uniref:TetR/AcrR family transcriptional regulator n=1 Tax=Glycomyces paridis TaxID=2126555 RepID=A0A4S8P9A1_9ACTN|nr:helix-turn-helix domain-containing protein [Glycomyces paridis]THV24429.1 TetR/AcrR family transcriptional regulator [Glycomyces paridis]